MKKVTELLINDQKFVVTGLFLKACKMLEVTLNEMYVLLYFENNSNFSFDPVKMSNVLSLTEKEINEAFSFLIAKKIIDIDSSKDADDRVIELINLNGLKQIIQDLLIAEKENNTKKDIYHLFETEFGRPISPMEYEIISAWITHGTPEELIEGALKEAVYNNAKSFRYIDKIIYDWSNKGFKTMEDVNRHLSSRSKKATPELFDYNWLEDEE